MVIICITVVKYGLLPPNVTPGASIRLSIVGLKHLKPSMPKADQPSSWKSYLNSYTRYPELGFSIDTSRMDIPSDYADSLSKETSRAFAGVKAIEAGEIMNPDEGRMVGHYWLRNPALAPSDEIRKQITEPIADLKVFAQKIRRGEITTPKGGRFENLLIIGIGGSALGPQFIYEALGADSP